MTSDMLRQYAERFRILRTDMGEGRPRPHKAVRLLSVITLADSGRLRENRICYSTELLQIFAKYFDSVRAGSDRCTPFNPFFYLKSDRFWYLHAQPGQEAVLLATGTIRGSGQLMALDMDETGDPCRPMYPLDPTNGAIFDWH
jgi:predicted restriction endonuclease